MVHIPRSNLAHYPGGVLPVRIKEIDPARNFREAPSSGDGAFL